MAKKIMGNCHICGKYGELSFEHIPPKVALNNGAIKIYTGKNILKRVNGENAEYQNQQQGMGKYSLCKNCNSITGSWYANIYSDIAKDVARSLHLRGSLEHGDIMAFSSDKFPALAFVKQVVTMFCSLIPLSEVERLGFDKFLLNKESNCIDNSLFDLRIYLTPIETGQLMTGPCGVIYKTDEGIETQVVTDLCAYPFGFILNLTPEYPVEYGASLIPLFDTEYGKEYKMKMNLIYLERVNEKFSMPLQYKPLP